MTESELKSYQQKAPGKALNKAESIELITDLVELLLKGYISDNQLSKDLKVSRQTIVRYKDDAMKIISSASIDQPRIRALHLQGLYQDLEELTIMLETATSVKEKTSIYNQRNKVKQQIALISGLNVETKINLDHKQLVIIKSHPEERKRVLEEQNRVNNNVPTN